jgi:hypothetical protein
MRGLLFALLVAVVPLKRVDRMMAVGAPVLDENASEGVYVWLEDGWFNVAAVSRSKGKRKSMSVSVRSTKKIQKAEGDFTARESDGGLSLSASVGGVVVKGRFRTEGDITVTTPHGLFVGPLSKPAASPVSIGRY